MNFFYDSNHENRMTRSEIRRRIEDLYGKIDDEKEKKEELLSEIRRTERAIDSFRALILELNSLLK